MGQSHVVEVIVTAFSKTEEMSTHGQDSRRLRASLPGMQVRLKGAENMRPTSMLVEGVRRSGDRVIRVMGCRPYARLEESERQRGVG